MRKKHEISKSVVARNLQFITLCSMCLIEFPCELTITTTTDTMATHQVTIPDLRFEASFDAKLMKNALDYNTKHKILNDDGSVSTQIPIPLLIKTVIIDQLIMPFIQSFALTSALFYLRPLIRLSARQGYIAGSNMVLGIKKVSRSLFFISSTK